MSTFISSVIPHQWRHAVILIKTNIDIYAGIDASAASCRVCGN